MAGLGGFPLSSATPSYPLPPKFTKQTVHQPPTDHIWSISCCIFTFPGVGGGGLVDGWVGGGGNNQT